MTAPTPKEVASTSEVRSLEVAGLCERLKSHYYQLPDAPSQMRDDLFRAAAALESIAAERNDFRDRATEFYEQAIQHRATIERLEGENTELAGRVIAAEDGFDYVKAERDRLREALQGLHDDCADYQRINNLGGYDNHWMKAARAALAPGGSSNE